MWHHASQTQRYGMRRNHERRPTMQQRGVAVLRNRSLRINRTGFIDKTKKSAQENQGVYQNHRVVVPYFSRWVREAV